jgi:hypothetical protein
MRAARPIARLRRRSTLAGVLGAVALAGLLGVSAGSAGAAPTPPALLACKGFKVLHNDRIGPASFPAGTYTVAIPVTARLSCQEGNELFARFLEDFDGVLPRPWTIKAEGAGKATFARGSQSGFSVSLTKSAGSGEGESGTSPVLGTLCNGTFSVNSNVVVGPLRFTKGKFLIYLPPKSGIGCQRASLLFTRFLAATPNLPSPWRLEAQTATFSKPANPARSAFRIEPLDGAGVR